MIGGEWRRGRTCDQRGQCHTAHITPQPGDRFRQQSRPVLPHRHPSRAPGPNGFVGGDQRRHRGERHLETGPQEALRKQQQHDDRRKRHHPERDGLPIQHLTDQDQADHEKGALGRHGRTGQQKIAARGSQRDARSDLLDRPSQRHSRDGGKPEAESEQHRAHHQRHMQARNRKQMGQPGLPEVLQYRLRDARPVAGQQRCGDRPDTGIERRADGGGHMGPHPIHGGPPCYPARAVREDVDLTRHEADSSDSEKVGLSPKVERPRRDRRGWRTDPRPDPHPTADRRRRPRSAYHHADPARDHAMPGVGKCYVGQGQPMVGRSHLHLAHGAGHGRPAGPFQHPCIQGLDADLGGGKADGHGQDEHAERCRRMPSAEERDQCRARHGGPPDPRLRLRSEREIAADANGQCDRQQQTPALPTVEECPAQRRPNRYRRWRNREPSKTASPFRRVSRRPQPRSEDSI